MMECTFLIFSSRTFWEILPIYLFKPQLGSPNLQQPRLGDGSPAAVSGSWQADLLSGFNTSFEIIGF